MKKNNKALKSSSLTTPLGPMLAIADDKGLYLADFLDRPFLKSKLDQLSAQIKSPIINQTNPVIDKFATELAAYFAGTLTEFTAPVNIMGTHFQRLTWQTLRAVPYGETRAYYEQAQAIKKPSASRAVANANGANRLSIIVPCHRIIRSNGDLGGYGGGVWRKTWLLEHEKKFH